MRKDGLLTVESLINILQNFDPERVVIMAQSFEANGFSPLSEITTASYFPLRSWEGTIGREELDELDDGTIPCIILDPRL